MKITFIQAGGTIDKDYPKLVKGYAFEIGGPAVKRILEKVNPNFEFEIIPSLRKDSLDITENDREKLYSICKKVKSDKVVITHGTDMMIETAKRLTSIKNKVIILTGAMKPEKFKDSDTDFNLGVAIGVINVLKSGVYIAMNGRVYPQNKCKRNLKTGQFVKK